MTIPSTNDYPQYTNKKLTDNDWLTMTQATVNAETDGTKDFTINSLTTTADVDAGGDITATGTITAASYLGDGSTLTGLNTINKNWIINGDARVRDVAAAYTLVNGTYGCATTQQFTAMASGTAVGSGTYTVSTTANCGRSGYAHHISGATITGTGIVYLRYRMQSKDAVNLINQYVSFGCQVYHNVGSSVNYTITINKANATDDFTAVTNIGSTVQAVGTATATKILYENVSMGNCATGVEIIISVACGAIITKSFEFTEAQLELSTTSTTYDYRIYENEVAIASKGKKLLVDYTTTGSATTLTLPTASAGLNLDSDFAYEIETYIISATTGAGTFVVQPNGLNSGDAYSTLLTATSTTGVYLGGATTGSNLGILLGYMPQTAGLMFIQGKLAKTSGQNEMYVGSTVITNATNTEIGYRYDVSAMVANNGNVTYFTFIASASSGIGAGSRFRIYGYK